MRRNRKPRSLYEKEMQSPSFRRTFHREWEKFKLEIQILKALKATGWTYEEFAAKIGTRRSHVSRDLKGGGLQRASLARITKMAKTLDMDFVALLIPHSEQARILPQLEKVVSL